MGYKLVNFDFVPDENEQIDAIVKVPKEPRSAIHGVVKDCSNKVVKDAVVKLFKMPDPKKPCCLEPLTHTFTDDCGQFIFGPLCPHVKYVVKVWINHVKIRELIISPDNCNDPCKYDHDDYIEENEL
ncbi:MAG: carboxypeptidase regulatory-like domain-containing protein [Marinisporobacter sp.]|jgi:hypothetical protein|nr:carboxypeptidase regulatory-like domain-containing protein [Marinisporobacter sp.]